MTATEMKEYLTQKGTGVTVPPAKENEEQKETAVFRTDCEYISSDWFSGGLFVYKVTSRTKTKVTFLITQHEADGTYLTEETHHIETDEIGEYVVLGSYQGYEHRLYGDVGAKMKKEDDWFVATDLTIGVTSQGKSEEEALANLKEAVELYKEES